MNYKKVFYEGLVLDEGYFEKYDRKDINELATSIQTFGQLEPCICFATKDNLNKYFVLSGGKRVRAIQKNYTEGIGDGYVEIKILDSAPKNNVEKILLKLEANRVVSRSRSEMLELIKAGSDLYDYHKRTFHQKKGNKRSFIGKKLGISGRTVQDYLNNINDLPNLLFEEKPEMKEIIKISANKKMQKRSPEKSELTKKRAHYKCEYNPKHKLFKNKEGNHGYVETHHLIPLSAFRDFDFSLDVLENMICLCPLCHKLLHRGNIEEKIPILEYFYNERKEMLKNCGLEITFEKLISYYR